MLYPRGSDKFFARIPVSESGDAQPAFAPSFAYNAVAIGLISNSNARYTANVVIRIPAAMCPGPIAEINAESTNIRTGIRYVLCPTNATTFFEKRSSVPFWEAIPNRKVTPTSVTNIELEKPAEISFADIFPQSPNRKAAPIERNPILIFLINPIATTTANTISEIIAIFIWYPPNILHYIILSAYYCNTI